MPSTYETRLYGLRRTALPFINCSNARFSRDWLPAERPGFIFSKWQTVNPLQYLAVRLNQPHTQCVSLVQSRCKSALAWNSPLRLKYGKFLLFAYDMALPFQILTCLPFPIYVFRFAVSKLVNRIRIEPLNKTYWLAQARSLRTSRSTCRPRRHLKWESFLQCFLLAQSRMNAAAIVKTYELFVCRETDYIFISLWKNFTKVLIL
jgi:hypothetical protein